MAIRLKIELSTIILKNVFLLQGMQPSTEERSEYVSNEDMPIRRQLVNSSLGSASITTCSSS